MEIHTLEKAGVDRFLKRRRKAKHEEDEFDVRLDLIFREILQKANEFVPSESGSILLDDPAKKSLVLERNDLVFVACFGPGSSKLVGVSLPATKGIVGHTYCTGQPYVSPDVKDDKHFYSEIDKKTQFITKSIICVPVVIGKSVCGVIELLNRLEKVNYTKEDLNLLEIFAAYTSTLIQNALDAKRHKELSKEDSLTGLFNDRFFHTQLDIEIRRAKEQRRELSLIFLDLDNFKPVNDNHGHLAGSRVLTEVGAILRDVIVAEEAVISRYGGDEFVIILPGINYEEAYKIGQKIRDAVKGFVFLKDVSPYGDPAYHIKDVITASIGIASYLDCITCQRKIEEDKNLFIKLADEAMYKAKEAGRDRVCLRRGDDTFQF
ncbi:MAG: sensor domain-containing diguanylate cyclase [Nitrospirae bacterium]|nr:sensor domain-containing diguanylate cyclase [Nitrospirota bacterium]